MSPEREAIIKQWRAKLLAADPDTYLGRLEAAHSRAGLSDKYGHITGRDFEEESKGEILDLIQMMISWGYMPPPEFLLALLDDWRAYLTEDQSSLTTLQKAQSLERHLIGKPAKGLGNYANQWKRKRENLQVVLDLHGEAIRKLTPLQRRNSKLYRQAFEQAASDQGKDIESLNRQWRRNKKRTSN